MLKSTVHRVVFEGEEGGAERYSMAYFCHPFDGARLDAVPGLGDGDGEEGRKQRQRLGLKMGGSEEQGVLTAKEHLDRRLKVTYGLDE